MRLRVALAVLAASAAGCAVEQGVAPSALVVSQEVKVIAPNRPHNAVTIGRSTRAEVAAALGETLVISFDSGYEVWVYRLAGDGSGGWFGRRDPEATGEYVILFAPTGVVAKTRTRSGQRTP